MLLSYKTRANKLSRGTGHKTGRRIVRRWLGGLCLVALAALGAVAWLHWPRAKTFYTDADTIHQSADEARLRDILWKPPVALPAGIVREPTRAPPISMCEGVRERRVLVGIRQT